jgi:hypothetical protein
MQNQVKELFHELRRGVVTRSFEMFVYLNIPGWWRMFVQSSWGRTPLHNLQNSMLSLVLLHNYSRSKSRCISKELRVRLTRITIQKRRKSYPVISGVVELNSAGLPSTHRSMVLALFPYYTIKKNSRPIKPGERSRLHEVSLWMHVRHQLASLRLHKFGLSLYIIFTTPTVTKSNYYTF